MLDVIGKFALEEYIADRFSIKSLTTRDELRNTHVLTPILHVNLITINISWSRKKSEETHISPYFLACTIPHCPCWFPGNWKVFPTMGSPGIRGGNLYFLLYRWLETSLCTITRATTVKKRAVANEEPSKPTIWIAMVCMRCLRSVICREISHRRAEAGVVLQERSSTLRLSTKTSSKNWSSLALPIV
jgi:hypothetical protein